MKADLVVLVADTNMKEAMLGLLGRPSDFELKPLTAEVLVHPQRDPGCRLHGHELLRTQQRNYRFALLILDHEGSGAEREPRASLETELEQKLAASGWSGRSGAIFIVPELETWVWSDSPHVDRILGWARRSPDLRTWLRSKGFVSSDNTKPNRPKEAVEQALWLARKPRSSAIYRELAEKVDFTGCQDSSFLKLCEMLRNWCGK